MPDAAPAPAAAEAPAAGGCWARLARRVCFDVGESALSASVASSTFVFFRLHFSARL